MLFVWIFGALAATAAGALLFVERRIRRRTQRVLDDAPAADDSAERLLELRMRHVHTGFVDEMPLPIALAPAGELDVLCTSSQLLAGPMVIPLASVEDAAIAQGALRLRFRRGGELLETVLEAPPHDLERLRREIHLRQPNVLQKLIDMVQQNAQGHGPR